MRVYFDGFFYIIFLVFAFSRHYRGDPWKKRDILPFLVFKSLERNDVPCKSDSLTYLPFLVFNSLERKVDPCKSDSPTFYSF